MILTPDHDPMGQAVLDYFEGKPHKTLRVLSSKFDEDEMPIPYLFRDYSLMPPLEQQAMRLSRGKVLDIGACAGCHALHLQNQGLDVTAIDISPLSVETMRRRGIRQALLANIYDYTAATGHYDTILLLMNGTTIAGTLRRLPHLLAHLKTLLAPNGQILIDSTDISYIYVDDNGNFDPPTDTYYGEVDYRMQYGKIRGPRFDCLYADPVALQHCAAIARLHCQIIGHGEQGSYLAQLTTSE